MDCIFCRQCCKNDTQSVSEKGKQKVRDCLQLRQAAHDIRFAPYFDSINEKLQDTTHWHRLCYSDFTNKTNIGRLFSNCKKRARSLSANPSPGSALSRESATASSTKPTNAKNRCRSSRDSLFSQNHCVFCRRDLLNEKLINVETQSMSDRILEDAKHHRAISLRLGGAIDLIALEAKYHLKCLVYFRREVKKNKTVYLSNANNNAMVWLVSELRLAAKWNHSLSIDGIWKRYLELLIEAECPTENRSRPRKFLQKIVSETKEFYACIHSTKNQKVYDENAYHFVPRKKSVIEFDRLGTTDEDISTLQSTPVDEELMQMVHVAARIRSDILSLENRRSLAVSEEEVLKCIPESLHTFIGILLGGFSEDTEEKSNNSKIQSLAQDVVYNVKNGKFWTPKHLGLACTLHQSTRSKILVNLFHSAGNTVSYVDVLAAENGMASNVLQHIDPITGAVVSQNLVHGRFVHFSADNIDLNMGSIDSNKSFHATQFSVWQRGPARQEVLTDVKISKSLLKLKLPECLVNLIPITVSPKVQPIFRERVKKEWYLRNKWKNCPAVQHAQSQDMAFFLKRQRDKCLGWTVHNETRSTNDAPLTTIGYLPIILAPAHEYDTLNTVVLRCMKISETLGQKFTVITVDQALYFRLMILKWNTPAYQEALIPRLGGLHIAMNFLKVIGQHISGFGIDQIWIESKMLGENSCKMVLEGKQYNRAIRAHKITLQALWSLLIPIFLKYLKENDQEYHNSVVTLMANESSDFLELTASSDFKMHMDIFRKSSYKVPNVQFWLQYMDMVSLLLLFTRSERDGIWDLYLNSFTAMLPYFIQYDHVNYAKWGSVYVAEMHQLPPEVLAEFQAGNFVVKGSNRKFNQVDPDHSLEWMNGVGKNSGGIIGLTQNIIALQKWSLCFNLKAVIAENTKTIFLQSHCDDVAHNESAKGRQMLDKSTEMQVFNILMKCHVFAERENATELFNPMTKDQASSQIQESLLNAYSNGEDTLIKFVDERICAVRNSSFHLPCPKNRSPTMASLYQVVKHKKNAKEEIVKIDRSILHRLLTAFKAGREVNMRAILKYELLKAPISLFHMNGAMRTGNKAALADILKSDINCPATLSLSGKSCLIIDGQALVMSIGKPDKAVTFGDVADAFVSAVDKLGTNYQRIDIIFDRYIPLSIKSSLRRKRTAGSLRIRRQIGERSVPVPGNWGDFIALPENKADLSRFLGEEVLVKSTKDKIVVVAGAFAEAEDVRSNSEVNVESLKKWHEEGDTRLILHALAEKYDNLVVMANDTDVFVLLVAHFPHITSANVWLMTGTSIKRCYVPIKDVCDQLPKAVKDTLLAFHAITGCDSTSFTYDHSKKKSFKVLLNNSNLLNGIGDGELTIGKHENIEKFFCKLYDLPNQIGTVNEGRHMLFGKTVNPESLPPTSDALHFHAQRCHYQTMIWKNIQTPEVHLQFSPQEFGWKVEDNLLVPVLMSLPAIPEICKEMISCGCKTGCRSLRCSCRKSNLPCTDACKCFFLACTCCNLAVENQDLDDIL